MTPRRRDTARAVVLALALALSGAIAACSTTVNEPSGQSLPPGAVFADGDTTPIDGGVIIDSVPTTTTPVAGTASDLLPELAIEMSRLGSQIATSDGDDATLARIESIWAAIRPELESTHPELVNGIGATLVMARTAVERTRPADADKAFSVLTDLVDKFTGDG